MILDDIQTARAKYAQENAKAPIEIVMDTDTADLLRIAVNKMMTKMDDKIENAEYLFGGKFYGMTITRWPGNEKGFAVR
jgi:hypothetical protein